MEESTKQQGAKAARLIREAAFETLWPTRCAICDTPGTLLCDSCRARLPYIDYWRACPRCGAPYGRQLCTECSCTALSAFGLLEPSYDACASVLRFDEASACVVRAWKDKGERRLGAVMARMMAQYVAPAWLAYPLLVVPVAASDRARRQRGYDHGLELACYLAEYLGRRAYSAFLPPKSIDQRQLSRKGRLQNMAQALMLRADFRPPSAVLLVDDVCTTGATLLCAAQALKDAGVASVFCITFARTY